MQTTATRFLTPSSSILPAVILLVTDLPPSSRLEFLSPTTRMREYGCAGNGVLDPREFPIEAWADDLEQRRLSGIIFLGNSRAMVLGRSLAKIRRGGLCFIPSLGGFEALFSRWFLTLERRKPVVQWEPAWAPETRDQDWLKKIGTDSVLHLNSVYQVTSFVPKVSLKDLLASFLYLIGRIFETLTMTTNSSDIEELAQLLSTLKDCYYDKSHFLSKGPEVLAKAWMTLGRKGLMPPQGLSFGLSIAASFRLNCDQTEAFNLFAHGEFCAKDREWFGQAFAASGLDHRLRHLGALTRNALHGISDSFVAQEFFPPGCEQSLSRALVYKVY